MHTWKVWIDGKWTDSVGGQTVAIENPANGKKIAEVVNGSRADVDRAVGEAKKAFYDGRWTGLARGDRQRMIWRLGELVEQKAKELARAESENTGKPFQYLSLGMDLPAVVDHLRFFSGCTRDTYGDEAGEYLPNCTSFFRSEPVGVVGQIAPWNYPLLIAVWKIGPALAAGCTLVLKPAPSTPLTTLMLAELTAEAGFPPGVVNVVTGGNETGQYIVEHPDVRLVSFTGSTEAGRKVMSTASASLKRVHFELGGKAPFIVFDDADPALVAEKATFAASLNTGQDCTAATRVYVSQSKQKQVTEALVEAMRGVKVGDPFDESVRMGPLISKVQRDRVHGFVERARAQSASVLTGGAFSKDFGERGYYYEPTVVSNVTQNSEIVQSEVFGPVITVSSFKDEKEAMGFANDVSYGLAASVWTKDIGRAMRMSKELEFGSVWINDHMPLASETPHGGFKQSGFGKDLSHESVKNYKITKHVTVAHT
ncbi:MAG TPA: aminobutyraldehyde dehydrogenase [Bryobacteraceae bacterium]|nr:aminobutyraldehyde dehydrogenase [Bryobacteraceae bacterium]